MLVLDSNRVARAISEGYDLATDDELFSEAFRSRLQDRGHLTRDELHQIGAWKAVRATGHMKSSNEQVALVSKAAFAQSDAGLANWILRYLSGVRVPMASAVLTVFDPERYTVVDYRALATLANLDVESHGLTRPDWLGDDVPSRCSWTYGEYVSFCRNLAHTIGVTLRDLDRALWALNGGDA